MSPSPSSILVVSSVYRCSLLVASVPLVAMLPALMPMYTRSSSSLGSSCARPDSRMLCMRCVVFPPPTTMMVASCSLVSHCLLCSALMSTMSTAPSCWHSTRFVMSQSLSPASMLAAVGMNATRLSSPASCLAACRIDWLVIPAEVSKNFISCFRGVRYLVFARTARR